MKFSLRLLFVFIFLAAATVTATAQAPGVDSLVGQFTSSSAPVFVRDISGDGRFVVFDSNGDLDTQRSLDFFDSNGRVAQAGRNNVDGNQEIYLFDYAQRRTFQLTNTRRALKNITGSGTANENIAVDVVNTTPVISNDGRWIAFISNAASTVAGNTNPAFFNGNLCAGTTMTPAPTNDQCAVGADNPENLNRPTYNQLRADGNLEIWLYRVPEAAFVPVDLSSGAEISPIDLSQGTFTRVTDTPAIFPPVPGTTTISPIVREDNSTPSINADGSAIAFISNRDLIANGNADANREIFVFRRTTAAGTGNFGQVTRTTPGSILQQFFNVNPTVSDLIPNLNGAGQNGYRVSFISTANNPVNTTPAPTNGDNADFNAEIFYANLADNGSPTAQVQITKTTNAQPEDTVNIFSPGRRMSRDGRFIAFETLSSNPTANGALLTGYALIVFDATPPAGVGNARQIGVRTFEDAGAIGGDLRRFPVFTDYVGSTPQTVVFASRLNYAPNGTIPTDPAQGLNPDAVRPVQFYANTLAYTTATPPAPQVNLSRLSKFFATGSISDAQPQASNSRRRIAFNLSGTELGGGNPDFQYEGYYLVVPTVTTINPAGSDRFSYRTGASARPVGSPQPIPTPSASPSPSPSPSVSPSPATSPTPVTPSAVPGLSPGMLATARLTFNRPSRNSVAPEFNGIQRTIFGRNTNARRFELPIELAGMSLTVNNFAAGIYRVDRRAREITFVVPPGTTLGTRDVVFFDNGEITRGTLQIQAAQPDIFFNLQEPSQRLQARVVNATNRVLQYEPFTVTTVRTRPGGRVPTVFRVYLTGVANVPASAFLIRVGNQTASGAQILTGAVPTDQPGVYSVDFTLPAAAAGIGDRPIVISVVGGGLTFQSRLDDTAPRIRIL